MATIYREYEYKNTFLRLLWNLWFVSNDLLLLERRYSM